MHHIKKNYMLKFISVDENDCINDTLSIALTQALPHKKTLARLAFTTHY